MSNSKLLTCLLLFSFQLLTSIVVCIFVPCRVVRQINQQELDMEAPAKCVPKVWMDQRTPNDELFYKFDQASVAPPRHSAHPNHLPGEVKHGKVTGALIAFRNVVNECRNSHISTLTAMVVIFFYIHVKQNLLGQNELYTYLTTMVHLQTATSTTQ